MPSRTDFSTSPTLPIDGAACDCTVHDGADHGRRAFLRRGALATAGLTLAPTLLPRMALAADGRATDTLVVVFLRGGMDGLSAVAPNDPAYLAARPTIAVPPASALALDERFGLHPALADLAPWFARGDLGVVHAIGDPDGSRSHFEAMATIERGAPGATSGWIARHLNASATAADDPLRGVAVGAMLPTSMAGTGLAMAIDDLETFHLDLHADDPRARDAFAATLDALWAPVADGDPLAGTADSVFTAIDELARSGAADLVADGYPPTPLGRALAQVAATRRAGVGVEIAAVDAGGWDTHDAMGDVGGGQMADRLADLGASMARFAEDLGDDLDHVTLVTVTEFGRRVAENGSGGTDHGRASASLVLGAGARHGAVGGAVLGDWPGVGDDDLEVPAGRRRGDGDLRVTTDVRALLGDALASRLGGDVHAVFPSLDDDPTGRFLG